MYLIPVFDVQQGRFKGSLAASNQAYTDGAGSSGFAAIVQYEEVRGGKRVYGIREAFGWTFIPAGNTLAVNFFETREVMKVEGKRPPDEMLKLIERSNHNLGRIEEPFPSYSSLWLKGRA